MSTILLPVLSNVFMTFGSYGQLKHGHDWSLWKAILVSWAIALIEYSLAVPANRSDYGEFSGFQLKIIQEIVTLVVFASIAVVAVVLFLTLMPETGSARNAGKLNQERNEA